jgi:hypothetical protein
LNDVRGSGQLGECFSSYLFLWPMFWFQKNLGPTLKSAT